MWFWVPRCFPKFPADFTGSLYSMLNTTSSVLSSAVSTAQEQWTSGDPQFSNYVADISKGVVIIAIGGLGCGMAVSLVSTTQLDQDEWSDGKRVLVCRVLLERARAAAAALLPSCPHRCG
jgi:hypothetical protein